MSNVYNRKIYYADTDTGGVVYYANYLIYFEEARTEFLENLGLSVKEYMEQGYLFVVVSAGLRYRLPAHYGDVLHIVTRVEEVKNTNFALYHEICRKRDGKLVVTGSARLACVNKAGKPTGLPEEFHEKLSRCMSKQPTGKEGDL
jgi:tol-pal system-associated acyl-CoA thioesterase